MNRYGRSSGPWRPAGVAYYLDNQRERLGVSALITGHPRVQDNRQLARIGGTTVQICQNYFDAPRRGDDGRSWADWQLTKIRATLDQCEAEIAKTHAIAAAAVEMTDEAYAAFGLAPPARNFSVVVASESAAESVEIASLRAEVDRLLAENRDLAKQVTAPAPAPAESAPAAQPGPKAPPSSGSSPIPSHHFKSRPAGKA